jgi:hypothetical protein
MDDGTVERPDWRTGNRWEIHGLAHGPDGRRRYSAIAFGSDAAAARYLGVSSMQVWRWRRDRSPLPEWVSKILPELLHKKVAEAHEAQQDFRYFLQEPPRPPRKLSGCCAGRHGRVGIPTSRAF